MKIISFNESLIDYIVKQDLLIPCYWYKVPIEINEGKFNFLEETIYRLKEVDNSLDMIEIAKMVGLEDRVDLIKVILDKIEIFEENNKKDTIYLNLFQEAITHRFLPVVAKNIDSFGVVKESYLKKRLNVKFIKFEKDQKDIKSYALNFKEYKPNPQKRDFFQAILKNNKNQSNSPYLLKININKISNFKIVEPELVYLHTRFIIPESNKNEFLISSGFDSGYLIELKDMLESNFSNLVRELKEKGKVESSINEKIELPFDLEDFPQIKKYFINIEKELKEYDKKDANQIQKSKEKVLLNLFDLIEKSFEMLSQGVNIKTSKERVLNILLQKYNFEYENNYILFYEKSNSIQEYFAKSLLANKDEIKELEIYSKKSLAFIEKLLKLRNDLKHSKRVDLSKIDIKKYREIGYNIVKILLNLKNKQSEENISYDEELIFNAYDDVKKDFFDEYSLMDEFIKDKLCDIYFYLNEIGYNKDKFNVTKEVVNSIYSIFEYILKNKIKYEDKGFSKEDVLNEFKNLPIELKSVRESMFEKAKQGYGSTLGAIYLIYLKISKNKHNMTNLISKIIKSRGHGNDIKILTEEQLLDLKNESFKFIKKLIRE